MKRYIEMIRNLLLLSFVFLLSACQLPNRTDVYPDLPANFSAKTIIESNNGLLSEGLNKVPGSICIADEKTGLCKTENLLPNQCLAKGTAVQVKAVTDPSPAYHSIITSNYKSNLTTPFISVPGSAEHIDEVKASISATASINTAGTEDGHGFPGIDAIKACILKNFGEGNYKKVIWIQAANIISVTTSRYSKVSNGSDVTGTGFGFNGSTYNSNSVGAQTIWIGIFGNSIYNIGVVSQPAVASSKATIINLDDKTTIIDALSPPTAPPPPATVPILTPPAEVAPSESQ